MISGGVERVELRPRALDALPRLASARALLDSPADAIHLADIGPPHSASRGWGDPFGTPYITVLNDAVFYPRVALAGRGASEGVLPPGLRWRDLGLMTGHDGALYPDSFSKSVFVHPALTPGDDAWSADLPEPTERLPGTWLFAELFFGHFGHVLTDMPARLWPLASGHLAPSDVDGALGMGMLGAGPRGAQFPGYAQDIMAALGFPRDRLRFAHRAVRVERLIVPRRIAPFHGLWHPAFSRLMRQAGAALSAPNVEGPERIWLSRSRFSGDPRRGDGQAALDALFEGLGFTVLHPQEIPFARQIALARQARMIAGPAGSQLHLCAFSETPGLRLLTVAPEDLRLLLNARLIADIGGTDTPVLLPPAGGAGPRQLQPWDLSPERLKEVELAARAWLADGM